MPGVDEFSEFDGGGVMPNTIFPKGSDALTPGEKLRLQSLTGQENDSRAPLDPAFWNGATMPDPRPAEMDRRAREREEAARRRQELRRYKQTPRQY